jgi:ligand-binding sensor domain-containing protein
MRYLYQWQNKVAVFLLCLICGQGQGQTPTLSFQYLSLQQGLSANYTTAITQDQPGFIWVATVKGLTRFDGMRCLTFTHQSGNAKSLSHRIVRYVFTAQNGTLWIGAQEGLNRFEPATQSFQRYSFSHLGPGCNFIRFIAEGKNGQLWLGTKGGVVGFNPANGQADLLALPTGTLPAAKSIRRILPDGHTLWIGTEGGLFAYDLLTKKVRSFHHDPLVSASLPDDYVTSLVKNPRTGEILIGTSKGQLTSLNPTTNSFRAMSQLVADQPISSLLFTKAGDLWVGIKGEGLHRYDAPTNRFFSYRNNETNARSLISNSISALMEDRAGVVWVLTDDSGICWFNPKVNKFHSLYDEVGYQPVNTLGFDAGGLCVDRESTIWVATRDGVAHINQHTKSYRLYRNDPKNPTSLETNFTYSVMPDQSGRMWVGTSTGLNKLDPVSGRVERIPNLIPADEPAKKSTISLAKGVSGNQVFKIIKAADGRLFMGTNEKLTIYDSKTDQFRHQFNDSLIRNLPGKNYNELFFDRQQNLWVGGFGPVLKISPDLRLLAQYAHNDDDPQSLPDEGVTAFAEDRFGRMWIGTDNGLTCLNQKTGKFRVFTTKQGLPHNDISAVLMVGDTLWLSTSRGVAYMDVRRFLVTVFDETDGYSPSEFESASVARDSSGRIYFGALRDLVYVQPNQIRLNSFAPPVYLTSFRVNAQELLPDPAATPTGLTLRHTQNMFTFEMAALSFDNAGDNRYAYRLEGFEDTWNQEGNRAFATYTNVPPGDYVLHVMAANNDSVWNRTGYRLPITILAPFWQTWWFRILSLSALVAITVIIARWREKRLANEQREKSELRERIAMSEMKALRSQMNPHFLYNSLNAIRLFILQNDSDNADKYLVKFARLMRLILDNSRQEWVTLASELEQLTLYLELEQLRFDNKFVFSITTDPALRLEKTSIPPMIIQPYIENAILHGIAHKKSQGSIQIRIERKSTHLACTIDDDGVGRQRAASLKQQPSTHQSVGLRVTEDRLQLIGQRSGQASGVEILDKYDDDQQSTGTRVVIELPFLDE